MNDLLVVAVLGWALGRNEPAHADHTAHLNSPMSQLIQCTQALKASLRREYPSWSPEAEMQRSVVRRLVGDSMDYREISRRALGHNWDQLSDGERNDFVSDLGTLIEKRYLLNEGAVGPDLRVNFEREALTDRGTASVFGTIVGHANRKNLHIALEYRLLWRNNRWVVYDLVTDGDSLLESYRAEFDRIIARETFAGLKRRMKRAQIAEDRAEERADR